MTIASIRHVQQDDGNVGGLGPCLEEAPAVRVGGGEAFDDDGADELAVDHALGLVEDDLEVGILLVDGVETGEARRVPDERLQGLGVAEQGEVGDIGEPLAQEVRGHLCPEVERALRIGGANALDGSFFETRDLFEIICHKSFFGKGMATFG